MPHARSWLLALLLLASTLADGYACRRPGCAYFGITDAQIHALVANVRQGHTDRIQHYRCQACGGNVSARWGTALSHLNTPGPYENLDHR